VEAAAPRSRARNRVALEGAPPRRRAAVSSRRRRRRLPRRHRSRHLARSRRPTAVPLPRRLCRSRPRHRRGRHRSCWPRGSACRPRMPARAASERTTSVSWHIPPRSPGRSRRRSRHPSSPLKVVANAAVLALATENGRAAVTIHHLPIYHNISMFDSRSIIILPYRALEGAAFRCGRLSSSRGFCSSSQPRGARNDAAGSVMN
jgi:hypothetical protein